MKLTINGEQKDVADSVKTITELLSDQDVKMPEMVSVEHNGEILDREALETTSISDGDKIEFLYFMGGGAIA